tara:strand:- start:1997 stop:7621 length:5625 start_codon:yes stop_codon:yes gene_type:complete
MANNITLNTNQKPYFDDFDENKNFHQVLYKPSLPVQARELTTQQSILRDQIKKFGDHVFQNGSKVSGADLVLNTDYEYVKLQPTYNSVDITVSDFANKTICGAQSGTKALVLNTVAVNSTTGDPDTLFVKYISGGSITDKVQGISVSTGGTGYSTAPLVNISGGSGSGAEATAVISAGVVIAINITKKGSGYTSVPSISFSGGGGTGAEATATLSTAAQFLSAERIYTTDLASSAHLVKQTPINLHQINITRGGSGYTTAPTVTIANAPTGGTNATATATITNGVVTSITLVDQGSGFTETPAVTIASAPAGGVTALATAELATAVGKGSSVSIEEGVFYIKGNFVKVQKQSLVLDNYKNSPSWKVGLSVTETLVESGDDTTLLDNALGASNFAAPGADRIKLTLTLTKKSLTSTDDSDFFELLRLNKGVKEKDVNIPVYSVLNETFARRTFDESGSYTVRAYNLQLKDHATDSTKFIARLDPGKSYVQGVEFETIISTDVEIDRARETVNVNNFDRLMQYGNYIINKEMSGFINTTTHQEVDLHSAAHASINLTDPTTYSSTKIGTAKVRQIEYKSGTGTNTVNYVYLYDVKLTTANSFKTLESLVLPADATTTPVVLNAKMNIDDTGKVGGTSGGDAKLWETNFNNMVFKLPQDVVKTIRDENSICDTSYTTKRVFTNASFTNGQTTLSSGGSTETFFGTGALSESNRRSGKYYLAVCKTALTGPYAVGDIIPLDGAGQSITVNGPSNTTVTFNANTNTNFTADIIATLNIDSKFERTKTLSKCEVKSITLPNTTALSSDSLEKSDIWLLRAVYDSGNSSQDATLPTLTVASTNDDLTVGETITGVTSGATGTVVSGTAGSTSVTYIPITGTFVAENVTGATSGFTKVVSAVAAGDTNITSRYELDNGQRDNFYDHGSVKLKAGQTGPIGRIKIVYDFFVHTGVGYMSVDSYTSAVGFDNVPKYKSPTTGEELELRDCVDFRPRRADGGTTIEHIELPVPNTNWQADYSYYLPRVDTVFVSREKKFGSNTGVSSLITMPPSRLDGTMDLYRLEIPAYTFKPSDIKAKYIENKRYTMRDIGKLEKRINNLEYYTALSLLEKDTEALVIKDSAGLDRFKNGILVDGFNGHSVGNVLSADYKCAIDFDERILRPSFISNMTDVHYDAGNSTGVQLTGDCVTLPYTTSLLINQPIASKAVNVNPFAILAWIGTIELDPPSDNWIDTTTAPEVVVNLQGENDAWQSLVGLAFGTQFNDWQTIQTGRETVIESEGLGIFGNQIRARETVEQVVTQTRTGIRNEITGVDTVRNSIGDRVVDVSVIPFIRSRDITVNVTGLKPNTQVYAFFDSENVSAHCTPNGGSLGGAIYTDDSGTITNLKFTIPNTDTLRFRTGERQFLLCDNTSGDLVTAGTYGEVVYQAQGLLQTRENVVVSSRVPRIQQFAMGSATDFRTTTEIFERTRIVGFIDPLAQTFLVDPNVYPDGVFLSSIDLYFKTKDTDGLPVTLQIRDTVNGYPGKTVLPFSDVSKLPDDIEVSEDASKATAFTFPSLVYLAPGEYAIVVLSNSLKYEAWIAEMGENIIGTTRKVSEQPYAGVFFKSQNASTWSPDQNQDLSFRIHKADFTIGETANAIFKDSTASADVKADIIQVTPAEVRLNKTNIAWSVKMTGVTNNTLDTAYTPVIQLVNFQLDTQKKITTTPNSYEERAQLSSLSKHISPVIDVKRNGVITIENIINNTSANETNSSGGDSLARYITRRVTLKDGFDATDLSVHLVANRQAGSSIKVYYKILSQFDTDVFDNRPWVEMTEASANINSISKSEEIEDYIDLEYNPSAANTTYTVGSVAYDSFKTFAIKIVMLSGNTTKVPLLKDLRVVALA